MVVVVVVEWKRLREVGRNYVKLFVVYYGFGWLFLWVVLVDE